MFVHLSISPAKSTPFLKPSAYVQLRSNRQQDDMVRNISGQKTGNVRGMAPQTYLVVQLGVVQSHLVP